jgi:transcriptional regulator with PAS, ATPase and Fis domain
MRVWVIEERELLAARVRSECPEVAVTGVRRERIASISPVPSLAVVDATERLAACSSIREMRTLHPAVPVLAVSPGCVPEPLPADIDDFVILPFQPGELRMRFFRLCPLVQQPAGAPADDETVAEIRSKYRLDVVIGESAALREAIRKVPRLGASEAHVLITGETGTGKELFARAIHYASARCAQPFVPVNCGALPDTLFENELFGHEKGAYTDASTSGTGLLRVAARGSLFLDEVDSLNLASQAKLLRVLQDREYRPLGSQRAIRADVRIIAAANSALSERIAVREFRADLYYRLNVLTLRLPPITERRDDIPILARYFLARFAKECRRPIPKLSAEAVRRLINYSWPGNVRELESVIHRAIVLSDGPILEASSLEIPDSWSTPAVGSTVCSSTMEDAIYDFERRYLSGLLSEQNGNVTNAAKAAGKDRRTFQRLLRRHGITRQESDSVSVRRRSAGACGVFAAPPQVA